MDNPLGASGVKYRTYRLPEQSSQVTRTLGPRSLEQVPPGEVVTIMELAARGCGWDDDEALMRGVLDHLNIQRLTKQIREQLEPIVQLAKGSAL